MRQNEAHTPRRLVEYGGMRSRIYHARFRRRVTSESPPSHTTLYRPMRKIGIKNAHIHADVSTELQWGHRFLFPRSLAPNPFMMRKILPPGVLGGFDAAVAECVCVRSSDRTLFTRDFSLAGRHATRVFAEVVVARFGEAALAKTP